MTTAGVHAGYLGIYCNGELWESAVSDLRHGCWSQPSGQKAALVLRLLQADEDNHADREVVFDHNVRPNEDGSAPEGTDNENDALSDNEGPPYTKIYKRSQ